MSERERAIAQIKRRLGGAYVCLLPHEREQLIRQMLRPVVFCAPARVSRGVCR